MTADSEIFKLIRERLFTAVIGDVMDAAGLTRQFLPPEIRALHPDMVAVGRAMPVQESDSDSEPVGKNGQPEPFGLMFRALDDLKANEIYITTGSSPTYALWGGLMSRRASALGASGAVLNGFHRDTREIAQLGFPVFSMGAYAQDQRVRGQVLDFRCTLDFPNGVRVCPGDVIVGDIDGVLVVPKAHLSDIVRHALDKVSGEDAVRQQIEQGRRTEDIFNDTGIM